MKVQLGLVNLLEVMALSRRPLGQPFSCCLVVSSFLTKMNIPVYLPVTKFLGDIVTLL
jgi:hypothetical protein